MDATRLAFESKSFDAIITSGLIHHLDDDFAKRALAEIRRVLKPSGIFLLWEDVPTRDPYNVIGRMVQAFDLGHFIRTSEAYAALLEGHFVTDATEFFRSGFMDYAVFRCRPGIEEIR